MRKISMGEGTNGAKPTQKKCTSCKNGSEKACGVRLSWKKEDQWGRPTCHRKVRKGGYDSWIGSEA